MKKGFRVVREEIKPEEWTWISLLPWRRSQREVLQYFLENRNMPIPVNEMARIHRNVNGEFERSLTAGFIDGMNTVFRNHNLPFCIRATEWGQYWYYCKLKIMTVESI